MSSYGDPDPRVETAAPDAQQDENAKLPKPNEPSDGSTDTASETPD